MSKVEAFSKNNIKEIRETIKEALQGVGNKYGVHFNIGTIRYKENQMRSNLEAIIAGPSGDSEKDKFLALVREHGHNFNIREDDYRREFVVNGKKFLLVGLNPKATKYPFVGLGTDDKKYKFHGSAVDLL